MRFYLGTHMPHWLAVTDVPLFISHRRLAGRRTFPQALTGWALDSGGFSELSMFGEWRTTPGEYVTAVRRYQVEVGRLEWCAPQDWMCEPHMLARTGLTVAEHQRRTVESFLRLRDVGLPVIPVLQGWLLGDYLRHVDDYSRAGVDLVGESTVGVGSVCRRQNTEQIGQIVCTLAGCGLRLHGFGVKTGGLDAYAHALTSADSMAWSLRGRYMRLAGCSHRSCANCLRWALLWRGRLLEERPQQLTLDGAA